MSQYVQLETTVKDHRKTMRLMAYLRRPRRDVLGGLALLWLRAWDHADKYGALQDCAEELAIVCDWPIEDAATWVDGLVHAGFLDRAEDGSLVVHGWQERVEVFHDSREAFKAAQKARSAAGNHKRWHVDLGRVEPTCDLCMASAAPDRPQQLEAPLGPIGVVPRESLRESPGESLTHSAPPPRITQQRDQRDLLRSKLMLLPGEHESLRREFAGVDVDRRFSEWVDWVLEEEGGRYPRKGNFVAFKGFIERGLKDAASSRR